MHGGGGFSQTIRRIVSIICGIYRKINRLWGAAGKLISWGDFTPPFKRKESAGLSNIKCPDSSILPWLIICLLPEYFEIPHMTENKHMLSIDFLKGILITHFSFCNTSSFLNDYAASQLSYICRLSNISFLR